ncbi:hypothetical protein [Oceanibaculum indicum]|uniref:Uncharacterized protein n=1 Tax=Oceanibaculum indicum P24 TaxID=1207063 RepID=K2IEK4_9PROT|nr:hypothetical protein [Oceanibaculum indicum]EKE68461.1 hypothetical protein P24_17563 [Oceanibaculum indicum P24]
MTGYNDDNSISQARKARPVITFDYSLYEHYLEDSDLTEDRKREFLETLWNLIVELMSLGYEAHPVQQAQDACGKPSNTHTHPPISGRIPVQSEGRFLENDFSSAAQGEPRKATERIQE